jgi:hypothetical protein
MWDYYIDIIKGVPKNYWGNAFIMQSDENLQKVLFEAELCVNKYDMTRHEALEFILHKNGLNINLDFTDLDQHKIMKWLNGA